MKDRLRSAFYLLALFAVLAVFAWARGEGEREDLPTGSSHSSAPDGARALFLWLEATGARPQRLERTETLATAPPAALFLVQPLYPVLPTTLPQIDRFMDRGGTIVLAGDSPATLALAAQLRVPLTRTGSEVGRASPPASGPVSASRFSNPDRPVVTVNTVLRVDRTSASRPLLEGPGGEWVAAVAPYRSGRVIVITSSLPLTNTGLRDPDTARWVYGDVVAPLLPSTGAGGTAPATAPTIAFDEIHHVPPGASPGGQEPSLQARMLRWALTDPLGSAAAYAGLLVFLYLLLSGRRLGPALRPIAAGAASRTMYEHVQALAGLYRRGAQFLTLRAHYAHQYRRRLARALGTAAPLAAEGRPLSAADLAGAGLPRERAGGIAQAIAAIDAASSERQLAQAVRHAEVALTTLRPSALSAPSAPSGSLP